MLKAVATTCFVLVSAAIIVAPFVVLERACSMPQINEGGDNKDSKASEPSKNNTAEQTDQTNPSATFDLRVAGPNKIEGSYYAKTAERKQDNWTRNFFCETKLSEYAVACFTFFLVIFTALLWRSTDRLSVVTENSFKVTSAVDSPIPLISAFKLVQFQHIPGEVTVQDPVTGGNIPAHSRIMFLFENKGRTVLRCEELCLEKFAGQSLPENPVYSHVVPWGFHLEKGPIWVRMIDELAAITPADVGAALAAYPTGAFWVYGYITYRNLLDERRRYKFLWRWDLVDGFRPDYRIPYYS